MKSPKLKKLPKKEPQKLADGSFVKNAGDFTRNMGLSYADAALGMLGANNVIQDDKYKGTGSNFAKKGSSLSGALGRVLLPTALNAAGVPPELTAGLQAAIGNEFNPESNSDRDKRLADEASKKKEDLAASFATNYSQALNDREMANYSEGGEIKGKGGPKSDSIKAEVKASSFVVPAENSGIAKEIREKFLGGNKKAKLNQEGGEDVKLSNGEHLFTPKEYIFLKANGINLDNLAPNADYYTADANSFAKGGLTPEKARIMLHDGTINGQPITDKQRRFFGWVSNGYKHGGEVKGYRDGGQTAKEAKSKYDIQAKNYAMVDAEIKRLENAKKQTSDPLKQRQYDVLIQENSQKREKLSKAMDILKKQQGNTESVRMSPQGNWKKSLDEGASIPNPEKKPGVNKWQQALDEGKAIGEGKSIAPKGEKITPPLASGNKLTPPKKESPAKQQVKVAQAANVDTNGIQPLYMEKSFKPMSDTEKGLNQDIILPPQAKANLNESEKNLEVNNQTEPITNEVNPNAEKKGLASSLSADYILPAYQMYAGQKMLNELGDRPVDSLSPEYLKNMEANRTDLDIARRNARFGLTPEEQFQLNQANQSALEAGRFAAKNYSGGSAANAFSMDQAAVNDNFSRKVDISDANRKARLQKQGLASSLQGNYNNVIADYQNRKRQLFGDKLSGWTQDQMAGAELQGAGMKNMVEASRYNTEKGLIEAIKKKYGV